MKLQVLPTWLEDQLIYSIKVQKIKVTKLKLDPVSKLPVLTALSGRPDYKGNCTESDKANVMS